MSVQIIDTSSQRVTETWQGNLRAILGKDICGAEKSCGSIRELEPSKGFEFESNDVHCLAYCMSGSGDFTYKGTLSQVGRSCGVYLDPHEKCTIVAGSKGLTLLQLTVPKIKGEKLTGGYVFSPGISHQLRDAGGLRLRTFCVNSKMPSRKGRVSTNSACMQAGEMRYSPNGFSPLHKHAGTDHFYLIFEGTGTVDDGTTTLPVGPGNLVFIPEDEPHRLRASESGLHYFEFIAPNQHKTSILSGDKKKDLKWFFVDTGEEWNQS